MLIATISIKRPILRGRLRVDASQSQIQFVMTANPTRSLRLVFIEIPENFGYFTCSTAFKPKMSIFSVFSSFRGSPGIFRYRGVLYSFQGSVQLRTFLICQLIPDFTIEVAVGKSSFLCRFPACNYFLVSEECLPATQAPLK